MSPFGLPRPFVMTTISPGHGTRGHGAMPRAETLSRLHMSCQCVAPSRAELTLGSSQYSRPHLSHLIPVIGPPLVQCDKVHLAVDVNVTSVRTVSLTF